MLQGTVWQTDWSTLKDEGQEDEQTMETSAKSLSFSLSLALSEYLSVSNRRDQTATRSRPAMRDQGPRARSGSAWTPRGPTRRR